MQNTVLCYIENDGKYLLIHRTKKKNDINKDKWLGIGGHFEKDESPFDCVIRETKEETGLDIKPKYRGIITFVSDEYECEQMHLFTCTDFSGELIECNEGELCWVEKTKLRDLNLWQGDYIFLDLIDTPRDFFSLKLVYEKENLKEFYLDGKKGKTLLVSACLLGCPCRYDGVSKPKTEIIALKNKFHLVPVCPEEMGGLPTPRIPAEIVKDKVLRADGKDVTNEYKLGSEKVLDIAKKNNIKIALLKAKSPSCGNKTVYDGTFSRTLRQGKGICADLIEKNGIKVYNEEEINELLEKIKEI